MYRRAAASVRYHRRIYTHRCRVLGLIAAFSLAADIDRECFAWFANLFGLADILIVASSLALVLLPRLGHTTT